MFYLLSYPLYLSAFFLFSFILWKRLKEDYTNEQIYGWTLRILLVELIVLWIVQVWLPDVTFLILFLTTAASGYILLGKIGIKFFEFIDAFAPAWFTFALLSWIGASMGQGQEAFFNLNNLIIRVIPEFLISILSLYLFLFFLKRYRRFSWYPSGKVGFAGLTSLLIFFFLYSFLQIYTHIVEPTSLPYIKLPYLTLELLNGIIGLVLSGCLIYMVYLRSGRK